MKIIVNPKETTRAQAFELWMKALNPMVTFFKTLDVTRVNSCDITEIDGAVGMNSGIFNNPSLFGADTVRSVFVTICPFLSNSIIPRWMAPMPGSSCSACRM